MRKRLSTIMAIVAALSMLFIAGPVMAATDDATSTTSGTVTFQADWTNDTTDLWKPLNAISIANLRLDSFNSTTDHADGVIDCTNLDVNGAFTVSAYQAGWTVPGDYNADFSTAKYTGDDNTGGIYIQFNSDTSGVGGADAGGLTVSGEYGSWQNPPLLAAKAEVLSGGKRSETGHISGVENAEFHMDMMIDVDYASTVPGNYENTITITFAETTSGTQ